MLVPALLCPTRIGLPCLEFLVMAMPWSEFFFLHPVVLHLMTIAFGEKFKKNPTASPARCPVRSSTLYVPERERRLLLLQVKKKIVSHFVVPKKFFIPKKKVRFKKKAFSKKNFHCAQL